MSILVNSTTSNQVNPGQPAQNRNDPPSPIVATLAAEILVNQEVAKASPSILERVTGTVGDPSDSEIEECKALLDKCTSYNNFVSERIAAAERLLLHPALKATVERAGKNINRTLAPSIMGHISSLGPSNGSSIGYDLFCKLIEVGAKVNFNCIYHFILSDNQAPLLRKANIFLFEHTEASQYCFSSYQEAQFFLYCQLDNVERLVKCGFDINARLSKDTSSKNETALLKVVGWQQKTIDQLDRQRFTERAKALLENGANPHLKDSDGKKPSDLCQQGTEMRALLIAEESEWSACEGCPEEDEDEIESSWQKLPGLERAKLEALRMEYDEDKENTLESADKSASSKDLLGSAIIEQL